MAVVIIGDTDRFEEHELVRRAVEDLGERAFVVGVQRWPGGGPIEYTVDGEACVLDERIPFDRVTGVFSMFQSIFPSFVQSYDWFDGKPQRVAYKQLTEWQRLFRSMIAVFEQRGAEVTVSPTEFYWNRHRPWMLELYDAEGVPVPETTFTNDPRRVREFVEDHSKAVVQMVNGGGRPEVLRPSDLEPDRMEKLATAPVKLQEYVPGADTRGYVVDGEFAGMVRYDYDPDAASFKDADVDYEEVESTPITPDRDLREAVVRAGELSPSAFAAVDVRVPDSGQFKVLESNTPGRFAHHDRAGSTDVGAHIAEYLT